VKPKARICFRGDYYRGKKRDIEDGSGSEDGSSMSEKGFGTIM
jgi:hypothetical protein